MDEWMWSKINELENVIENLQIAIENATEKLQPHRPTTPKSLSSDNRGSSMKLKIRLIWRKAMVDCSGVVSEYVYKTDDVVLPEDAQAFQFQDTEKCGWMPELVGGEWITDVDL